MSEVRQTQMYDDAWTSNSAKSLSVKLKLMSMSYTVMGPSLTLLIMLVATSEVLVNCQDCM